MDRSFPALAPLPAFPLPLIAAAVLIYLFLRASLRGGAPLIGRAVLLACAAQSLLVALTQHYGAPALIPLQVLGAFSIPPLVWVAFRRLALRGAEPRREAAHLLWPGAGLLYLIAAPDLVDVAIVLGFFGYGVAILVVLRARADELPRAALGFGPLPATLWRLAGWALIGSALTDALISADLLLGEGRWRGWIISISNSALFLGLGALSLSDALRGADDAPDPPAPEPPAPKADEADAALMARLEALMARHALHLDPELTLARLARRLGVPAKTLSGAINRATGENVSRYVNEKRVRAACAALADGASVTAAMLQSGFATKSNFNREFARVTGAAPSQWAMAQAADGQG